MEIQPNLRGALALAGRNLIESLCPEQDYMPYWSLDVTGDYGARLKSQWPAHNLGRWWDAVLKLEEAIGFEIPAAAEAGMLRNLKAFFNNPDGLCLSPSDMTWAEPVFELHSLRESLFALLGRIRYRNDTWAASAARRMLGTILRALQDDGSWNLEAFEGYGRLPRSTSTFEPAKYFDPVGSHGRFIEPVIEYYELTSEGLALDIAERLVAYHYANSTSPDGTFNPSSGAHHTHSYFNTLRGLLRYGELVREARYVERVRLTYEATVRKWVKRSGFTAHDIRTDRRGETASPGDAAQIALWLSRCGYSEYLDDAERIVRARLLPSQITESPTLRADGPEAEDAFRNLTYRAVGAFGGMHYEPHAGKHSVTDVTGAGVHTLVDLYRNCVIRTPLGIVVNFHFDHDGPLAVVKTKRSGSRNTTTVQSKVPGNVGIRLPRWTPRTSIRAMHNGNLTTGIRVGALLVIPSVANDRVAVSFDLPEDRMVETTDGVNYEFTWRGDSVVAITPQSSFLPFYPIVYD